MCAHSPYATLIRQWPQVWSPKKQGGFRSLCLSFLSGVVVDVNCIYTPSKAILLLLFLPFHMFAHVS